MPTRGNLIRRSRIYTGPRSYEGSITFVAGLNYKTNFRLEERGRGGVSVHNEDRSNGCCALVFFPPEGEPLGRAACEFLSRAWEDLSRVSVRVCVCVIFAVRLLIGS